MLSHGQQITLDLSAASLDPVVYPSPTEVKLDRPLDSYLPYTIAVHPYIGSEASIAAMTAMFKVICGLKNLRRASGSGKDGAWYGESQGELKRVIGRNGLLLYMTADQSAFSLAPGSMKVMWDVEED